MQLPLYDLTSYINTFLKHDPRLTITADLLINIVRRGDRDLGMDTQRDRKPQRIRLAELFLRYGKRTDFTDELREMIDREYEHDPEVKELFYKLEKKDAVEVETRTELHESSATQT